MSSVIQVFDHSGNPIGDMTSASIRSWVVNDVGRCNFNLSTSDPHCTPDLLQYGNFITVTHVPSSSSAGQLPLWTGVILPPRQWDYGSVNVAAFSAEALLQFRAVTLSTISGTSDGIFRQLLGMANAGGGFPIQAGDIAPGSVQTSEQLRTNCYDHIATVATRAGAEWDVTGAIDSMGRLALYGNWYGGKRVQYVYREFSEHSIELTSPLLMEQGTIYNSIVGYSDAQTSAMRVTAEARDAASISDYGLLQGLQTFSGTPALPSAVLAAAQARVATTSRPMFTFAPTAIDQADNFGFLRLGNVWRVQSGTFGFHNGQVGLDISLRITGMEYDDLSNRTRLTTEAA